MATQAFELLETQQQLDYDGVRFPAIINAAVTRESLMGWVDANHAVLERLLAMTGAVLFRGFPIDDVQGFDRFSHAFGYASFTYEASLSNAVRVNHTKRVFSANEAPGEVEIFLHHEMAQTPVYPSTLFFYCQSAAETGGATPLCRSDKLYQRLSAVAPDWARRFEEVGVTYTTVMPPQNDPASGQGRSWQSTLGVDSVAAAEAKLRSLKYRWTWRDTGELVAVTPPLPAVRQLADGSKAFFNQLVAAYLGWKGVKDDPSVALEMGDGTLVPKQILDLIGREAYRNVFDLLWQDGDVAMIDNLRVMHGRRPYGGNRPRRLLVSMARAA